MSIEKRYRVKLSVLPQILPHGMSKLAIDASRTFLKPTSSDIGFTCKGDICEILANANVVMRTGAVLRDANLHGADLDGVNLSNADLQNANLTGRKWAAPCSKAPTSAACGCQRA